MAPGRNRVTFQTTFARAPHTVTNRVLDYGDKQAMKIFESGSSALSSEQFEIDGESVIIMLSSLKTRAKLMNWDSTILTIRTTDNTPVSLLTQYAMLTYDDCVKHVKTYLFSETRASQDDYMLYLCLRKSLTLKADAVLTIWDEQFTLTDTAQAATLQSGVLLLKSIITKSQADTTATSMAIREKLSNLHIAMQESVYDIRKFNLHVK